MEPTYTYEKVTDTTFNRIEVIPQTIVPEQTLSEPGSLDTLEMQRANNLTDTQLCTDRYNSDLAGFQSSLAKLDAEIAAVRAVGVVTTDELPPIDTDGSN